MKSEGPRETSQWTGVSGEGRTAGLGSASRDENVTAYLLGFTFWPWLTELFKTEIQKLNGICSFFFQQITHEANLSFWCKWIPSLVEKHCTRSQLCDPWTVVCGSERFKGGHHGTRPQPAPHATSGEMDATSCVDSSQPRLLCQFSVPLRKISHLPYCRFKVRSRKVTESKEWAAKSQPPQKWHERSNSPEQTYPHDSVIRTPICSFSGAQSTSRVPHLARWHPYSAWPTWIRAMPIIFAFSASYRKETVQGWRGQCIMEPTNCFLQRLLVPLQKREGRKTCICARCPDK